MEFWQSSMEGMAMKILITGSAGFIGFHLSMKLLSENHKIIGLDDLNSYYNTNYKKKRLSTQYLYSSE